MSDQGDSILAHKTDPFSVRLNSELYERLFDVIRCTGGEITKTDIIERAINSYLSLLDINPGMIPQYDPSLKKSVTHFKKAEHKK